MAIRGEEHEKLKAKQKLAAQRTLLASRRTFLAYIRTALTILVAGVSIVKLLDGPLDALGWMMIPTAGVVVAFGLVRFREVKELVQENLEYEAYLVARDSDEATLEPDEL